MDFKYVLNDRHLTLYSSNGLNRRHKRTYIGLYTVQMVFTDAKKMTYTGLYTVQMDFGDAKMTYIGLYTVQMDVEDVPNDIHWTLYSSNGR